MIKINPNFINIINSLKVTNIKEVEKYKKTEIDFKILKMNNQEHKIDVRI